ncbi:MAG: DNA-binding protein [Planctomycetota bacterium]
MTKITLTLEDSKVQKLKEKTESYGLKLEQFVTAPIEDLISQPEPEFNKAVKKVLEENKELYKRLA